MHSENLLFRKIFKLKFQQSSRNCHWKFTPNRFNFSQLGGVRSIHHKNRASTNVKTSRDEKKKRNSRKWKKNSWSLVASVVAEKIFCCYRKTWKWTIRRHFAAGCFKCTTRNHNGPKSGCFCLASRWRYFRTTKLNVKIEHWSFALRFSCGNFPVLMLPAVLQIVMPFALKSRSL